MAIGPNQEFANKSIELSCPKIVIFLPFCIHPPNHLVISSAIKIIITDSSIIHSFEDNYNHETASEDDAGLLRTITSYPGTDLVNRF